MNIEFQLSASTPWQTDCLLLPTFEEEGPVYGTALAQAAPWLANAPALADHSGKNNTLTMCYGDTGNAIPRVLAVGLGSRGAFTSAVLRNAVAAAVQRCQKLKLTRLAMAAQSLELPSGPEQRPALVEEAVIAALLSVYTCTIYRSADSLKNDSPFAPSAFALLYEGKEVPEADASASARAVAVASGICLTRDLVNGPANTIIPSRMAQEASDLAARHGFNCRVLGPEEIQKCGMGALLAVASGSPTEPRFIVLEHSPEGMEQSDPLILIGKGVTFDTGGISLKPAENMHKMKGDMAGAAAVLGVFEAIGRTPQKTAKRIVGLMPCAENMPGGSATRPGDIVTTMSGKTVEILNTDAEGRLLLCDALTYAQQEWTPAALVDIATLTGACVVALGRDSGGLYCDDAPLRDQIMALGEKTGDRFWPLPLWKDFLENIKSPVADLANVGPREGGSISAALFLKQFVADKTAWAHLDIAGPGYTTQKTPLCPVGGTGFGVRTLYDLATA